MDAPIISDINLAPETIASALNAVAAPVLAASTVLDLQPLPLARSNAPKLSASLDDLVAIETSGRLSNYGPVNDRFEQAMLKQVFKGRGCCLSVCNATIGLMLALKEAAHRRSHRAGGYVLMPSFTFAAAAHAVLWAGLEPLLVDIDETTWAADPVEERRLLDRDGERIVAIMPYATFGSAIDLTHYDRLADEYDLPVIVDAAASMGSLDEQGVAFGSGSRHTIVFSMHATKAFAVGECGLIYSADQAAVERLRRMGNFGFEGARSASMPGLNSKISEVVALSALIKLRDFETQAWHRMHLAEVYRNALGSCQLQDARGQRVPYQFMPALLPKGMASHREAIIAAAAAQGITIGTYFSPHIQQQPFFAPLCHAGRLSCTDDVASRIVSLPISDFMTVDDAFRVATFLDGELGRLRCRT